MIDEVERLLTGAATAADSIVATWEHDSGQTPRTRPFVERDIGRHRLGHPIAAAAAIASILLATLLIARPDTHGTHGTYSTRPASGTDAHPAQTQADSAAASSQSAPTAGATPPERALQLLRNALTIGKVEQIWRTDGTYAVAGQYLQQGRQLATVTISVAHPTQDKTINPCVLAPGQQPGRDGAPAPEDRCTYFPQPTGPGIWLWQRGYSTFRPWTNQHTINWDVSYRRSDNVQVRVDVDNLIAHPDSAHPTYANTPFTIAKTTLIKLALSPQLRLTDYCTHRCVVPTDPTGGSS